jgi:hypothetical protein
MSQPPVCPRCAGALRPPDLWSSEWRCGVHGDVAPFYVAARVCVEALQHVLAQAIVPVWLPQPMLPGWTVSGLGHAGDERSGGRATVVAISGPSPLGGPADLLLIAEEPGVGLGCFLAGLPGPDPGIAADDVPDVKVQAAGHPTPLWATPAPADRAAFAGEAKALWLWALVWPANASLIFMERVELHDLRNLDPLDVLFGAPTPRLRVEEPR